MIYVYSAKNSIFQPPQIAQFQYYFFAYLFLSYCGSGCEGGGGG